MLDQLDYIVFKEDPKDLLPSLLLRIFLKKVIFLILLDNISILLALNCGKYYQVIEWLYLFI